jgi:hypothetical protein
MEECSLFQITVDNNTVTKKYRWSIKSLEEMSVVTVKIYNFQVEIVTVDGTVGAPKIT